MPAQRQASAFQPTFGPDLARGTLTASLAVLAGGALLAAPMMHSGLGSPAVALLGWLCSRRRPASLRWVGQHGRLGEKPAGTRVVIDLGVWLLLRLAVRSRLPRYLPLARTGCAARWRQRRATLCPAPTPPSPEP